MDGNGGCWDDDITSDEMDHSPKFPAFSTSKSTIQLLGYPHDPQHELFHDPPIFERAPYPAPNRIGRHDIAH